MVGQKVLLNKLNNYNINTFPRSVILIGEEGSGKHLISEYIKDNILKLPLLDITQNISNEYIDEIYRNPKPVIYLIDVNDMTEKEQNILLKFIEEPLKNAFIILLVDNKNNLLNTVYNRCISFELDFYTKEELNTFLEDKTNAELILNVLRTPGKILNNNLNNITEIYDICSKIISKLNVATYANTLTISNKINFKDEYNKFDLDIFLDTLIYCLLTKYKEEDNSMYLKMYLLAIENRKKLIDKRINRQHFMDNFLTQLWKVVRN